MTDSDVLVKEVRGFIGTLMLARPEKRNSLSPELLVKIHLALREWAESGEVRAVVITGSGDKAFSAGFDIGSIPTGITPEIADIIRNSNPVSLAMESVASFPYPTIAMMNGYAYGAGLNLALCCDFRIAVEGASVSMPPVRLGLVYHPDGIRQFIEVVGMQRTREIFLTGRRYSGRELLEMGLVSRLVPADRLSQDVYALAEDMAANAPLALKGTKQILKAFRNRWSLDGAEKAAIEAIIHRALESRDFAEGQAAFFERRKPHFTGR